MFHVGVAEVYRNRTSLNYTTDVYAPLAWTAISQYAAGKPLSSEDINLAYDMCLFYYENRGHSDPIGRLLSVEEEIVLPIKTSFGSFEITTHCDLIFEDSDGVIVVRDHKTKDALPSDYSWFDLDVQMMIYAVAAWRKYGVPCRIEHNLVRREVPPGYGHRPLINEGIDKNGKPYKRRSTASTDPTDYMRRFSFIKSEDTLLEYEARIAEYLEEMHGFGGLPVASAYSRSPGPLCSYCPYQTVCIRELGGEVVTDREASILFNTPQEGQLHASTD
jgi:hypothetical protein